MKRTKTAESVTRNLQFERHSADNQKLDSRVARGWFMKLACQAEFVNDTSVIAAAVLAGQLHPDMLYLVDFTGTQSAVMFGSLHQRV